MEVNLSHQPQMGTKKHKVGHRLAQVSHVQRLCPHCSGPGFESRPGIHLLHVSHPLSSNFLSYLEPVQTCVGIKRLNVKVINIVIIIVMNYH